MSVPDPSSTKDESTSEESKPQTYTEEYARGYEILKTLGTGSFGTVNLALHIQSKQLFAMKYVKKSSVARQSHLRNLEREFSIMKELDSSFCVKLAQVFHTSQDVCFVMEMCPGGDFFDLMFKILSMSKEAAIFYSAELFCAIKYLHGKKVVHQDLKLENLLLTHDNHLKICDFGIARNGVEADTLMEAFSGTISHMSPEKLRNMKYTKLADWWSFGIILVQFFEVATPFHRDTDEDMISAIISLSKIQLDQTPEDALDLANNLLQYEERRYKEDQIQKHHFFNDVVWSAVENRTIPPPSLHRHPTALPIDDEPDSVVVTKEPKAYTAPAGLEDRFDEFVFKRESMF